MKKKLCALFLALLMAIPLSGCIAFVTAVSVYDALVPVDQQYAIVLNSNWEIELPQGYEQLYYESEELPRGEGLRYCALRYAEEAALDGFREWTGPVGATSYHGSYTELVEEAIEVLFVPEEYHPDYEAAVWWYYHARDEDMRDEILMLRNGEMLYIIEGFY